jgi:adenylate cyclase
MTEHTSKDLTILFADVVGSVDLYTQLGDMQAHQRISLFQQSMAILVERNHGRVVETIGDEIMCVFSTANDALTTACAIQESLKADKEWALRVRIGFHSGLTGVKDDDHPFGDTVNVAARVVALAAAGQVMLTDDVCQRLSQGNRTRTNYFGDVYIKGKQQPYTIHQALWDQEQGTVMVRNHDKQPVERRCLPGCFLLRHLDTEILVTEGNEVLLGRGEQCTLRVDSEAASRIHAILKCRAGRLIIADRSTNGTFIRTRAGRRAADNSELFIHHDEWITTCDGVVSPGRPISSQDAVLIHFNGT